jgi:hypothetical protein
MKQTFLFCSLLLALIVSGGCISNETTNYRDPDRVKISFENEAAGKLFYDTLAKLKSQSVRSESKTEICIPIVFDHKSRTVDGDNILFNSAVRDCDTNGDGVITELEARIFSENAGK